MATNIPKNLDEAIEFLISDAPPKQLEKWLEMEEKDAVSSVHFEGGRNMRNRWGLWNQSDLAKWFITRGISHPDDMSGIIFTSAHRRLNGRPTLLKRQIKYYQDYWKKAEGSAILCCHANENPAVCECLDNYYYKSRTCKNKNRK